MNLWEREVDHESQSPYRYPELPRDGLGKLLLHHAPA